MLSTVLLLLAVSISCKNVKEFTPLHDAVGKAECLLRFNKEEPGTDCEVRTQPQRKKKKNQKGGGRHLRLHIFHWFDCHLQVCVCVSFVSKIPDSLRVLYAERKRHNSSLGNSQHNGMQHGQLATEVWRDKNIFQKARTSVSMLFFLCAGVHPDVGLWFVNEAIRHKPEVVHESALSSFHIVFHRAPTPPNRVSGESQAMQRKKMCPTCSAQTR